MDSKYYGKLSVIGMKGSEDFLAKVDDYIHEWRGDQEETYIVKADCPRFGTGEGKGIILETLRGHDTYIYADVFNYGVKYKMYGQMVPMSPDDHFQDLKRMICATAGKARRVSVIMPMLYEGRQHKRSARESLDCATALQELVNMGVTNIITFDAHDPRVQNAIPRSGFDNVRTSYQMIKALVREYPDITFDPATTMIISPDEGGMSRAMYYSSVLGVELGMFYKRRNYTIIVDGRNPIEAHEFLGKSVQGKDVIIVDDMISSGDSVIDVADKLKGMGAKRIFGFFTFGLFCNGFETIDDYANRNMFDRIYATNAVYNSDNALSRDWFVEVNVMKYAAYYIEALNINRSVSVLMDPIKKMHALCEKYNIDLPKSL